MHVNPTLLQENGDAILLEQGGDILLEYLPSRLSKIVAWDGRVPFTIKYCVKCNGFIKENDRGFHYCDTCAQPTRKSGPVYVKLKTYLL